MPTTRKWIAGILLGVVFLAAGMLFWNHFNSGADIIPKRFGVDLPESCLQVILVEAEVETDRSAVLTLLERGSAAEDWHKVDGPIPVSIGRNGLAWGTGEHSGSAPKGFRIKHEGDGCSPTGIFRIPFVFGYAPTSNDFRLNYVPVTSTLMGIEDTQSKFYNQVVDAAVVTPDWTSRETMLRDDGVYRWGAFIANNPASIPGAGSCIFMHLWHGAGVGTAGCTAMAEPDLLRVFRWLDPVKDPRLVQGLASW